MAARAKNSRSSVSTSRTCPIHTIITTTTSTITTTHTTTVIIHTTTTTAGINTTAAAVVATTTTSTTDTGATSGSRANAQQLPLGFDFAACPSDAVHAPNPAVQHKATSQRSALGNNIQVLDAPALKACQGLPYKLALLKQTSPIKICITGQRFPLHVVCSCPEVGGAKRGLVVSIVP